MDDLWGLWNSLHIVGQLYFGIAVLTLLMLIVASVVFLRERIKRKHETQGTSLIHPPTATP